MSQNPEASADHEFDDVKIDRRNFQIIKSGAERRITPRAFEVLLFLVENAGRVVSKQELFDEVWKESFVTDNALTRMVKEIRQVLGDDADAPRYIETIPKRGYRFIALTSSTKNEIKPPGGVSISSIAVLPFTNTNADAESEYLSEAITENIINNLSKSPDLRVVPRSVVFSLAKGATDALETGRRLNVRTVAGGRVLQRGENLIVSAELIDVEKQAQLWGEKYQYKTADLFDLHEEISRKISSQLQSKLIPEAKSRPTQNPEAYRLYLKGRYFWNRRPHGLFKGIEYFEQALGEDENFALAYAGLADSYSTLGSWENGSLPPNLAMPKACAAALNALALDDTLAEAHTTLAYTKFHYDWKFSEAEAEIRHALELNPNYVHAHHWLSHIHMARGETHSSFEASLQALELDPLDLIINAHLVWHHWLAREPEKALRQAEKTRELDPTSIWSSYFAGLALEQEGAYEEAAYEFRRALALSPEVSLVKAALGHSLGMLGEKREARAILAELENLRSQKFVPAYDIAVVRLGLGEKAAALDWLVEAEREHSGWLAYLAVESRLDSLREMPEFKMLLARVLSSRS
jgi:DNA-binding winged helix-turn-helix (wHTH) protein/Tfp pilus assembly protein PilF